MLKELYRINQASGLTIQVNPDGSTNISGCTLSTKDKQLTIDKKISGLVNIEELYKSFPPKTTLALNLSGKGVLTKQLERIDEVTAANFNLILPNANFGDFYIQNAISGTQSFISLIRKSEGDRWFKQLTDAGYDPAMLSLGPFPVLNIIDDVNIYGEAVVFDGHVITRSEQGNWQNYLYKDGAKAEFKLKIQNETIDESLLLPYAIAFQLLLHQQIDVIKVQAIPFDQALFSKQVQQRLRANSILILGTFFLLLLINFILFSWLASTNNELTNKLTRTQQNTNDIKISNEQVKGKEALLTNLGWDNNINKSWLIDQIAVLLPADIKWTAVDINPVVINTGQQNKTLDFTNRYIKVAGLSPRVLSVNEWIARIKTKRWIKNVQLDNYTFNNELNSGVFILTIAY